MLEKNCTLADDSIATAFTTRNEIQHTIGGPVQKKR